VKRRGRPRKVRDVPNVPAVRGKKLFEDDGHNSSDEESISGSDHHGHGEDEDSDDDANQPLINTIRSSAAKLRSLKVSQQGTSSRKGAPRPSGKFQDFLLFMIS
jgi:cohesin complex subunit SA-1/2